MHSGYRWHVLKQRQSEGLRGAPVGEIEEVLVGFESRPVKEHVILKLRFLTISEHLVFLHKEGTEHMLVYYYIATYRYDYTKTNCSQFKPSPAHFIIKWFVNI